MFAASVEAVLPGWYMSFLVHFFKFEHSNPCLVASICENTSHREHVRSGAALNRGHRKRRHTSGRTMEP